MNGHSPMVSQRTNITAKQLNTTAERAIMLDGKKSTKALQALACQEEDTCMSKHSKLWQTQSWGHVFVVAVFAIATAKMVYSRTRYILKKNRIRNILLGFIIKKAEIKK